MSSLKFAIKTLGCKVNQYEEQVIRENLERYGFRESSPQEADLLIVNSCTVTGKADMKTRKLIKRAKRENPGLKIFVTGCYAVFGDDIKRLGSMSEVHRVIPGKDKMKLPSLIGESFGGGTGPEGAETEERISSFGPHTRAFVKIQDGCDGKCSYCKVNLVRGPSRSRDAKEVLDELTRLIGAGYREMVLTGICLGSWKGRDGRGLSAVLRDIERLPGDFRIRLSSLEPDHIDDELIDAISSSGRICRHLHIPLQSGSDRVLRLMNRRYDAGYFAGLVRRVRERMPLAGITMDVIAGFPGETEKDLGMTVKLVEETRPSRLHVFKYSDRKGTVSSALPGKVPDGEAGRRVESLIGLGKSLQEEFAEKFVGRPVDVMVEKKTGKGFLEGYTGEYVRTRLEGFDGREQEVLTVRADAIDREADCLVAKKAAKSAVKALC